ncbi:MAG: HU family DNA-binding protein [Desulfovibrionales bacterium]
MSKEQVVGSIQEKAELETKAAAETVYDVTIASIREELGRGEQVTLRGFGTFSVVTRAARLGRNPQTGAPIQIPESKVVKFVPGKNLKEAAVTSEGKRDFTRTMEARLKEMKTTIDTYWGRREKLPEDARNLYQENIRPKYDEARLKFKLLRASSGDVWDEMKLGFEKAFGELRDAFHKAKKKI